MIPKLESFKAKIDNLQALKVVPICLTNGQRNFGPKKLFTHTILYCKQTVLTTLFIRGTRNAISISFTFVWLTVCHMELIFWHQNDVSGCCHMVF